MVHVRRTDCAWEDGCVVKDLVQVVLNVHIFAKEWKEWVMQL